MRVSTDKRYNEFVTDIVSKGWSLVRKGNHFKLLTPTGKIAGWVSSSPSDRRRGFLNFKAEVMRRACT